MFASLATDATDATRNVAERDSRVAPSAEMLLFLAEFSDADGEFVDPLTLEASELAEAVDDDKATSTRKAREAENDEQLKLRRPERAR